MFQMHSSDTLRDNAKLRDTMFYDRKVHFVDRHKWPLVIDGSNREIDQYDNDQSKYLIFSDNQLNHLASLRISPTNKNSMIQDHFLDEFPFASSFDNSVLEITRLCISRKVTPSVRRTLSRDLIRQIYLHALQADEISSIVGLCAPSMLRVYRMANAFPNEIHYGTLNSELCLAKWTVSVEDFFGLFGQSRD